MNPLFQDPSPYDGLVGKAVTGEGEDWGRILEVCDKLTLEKEKGAKEALRPIVRHISHHDPTVGVLAVVLLNACFHNGGKPFQIECAQQPLLDEIYRLLQTKTNTAPKVCQKLLDMLQEWVLDTGDQSPFYRIYSTYNRLKSEGHAFPRTDRKLPEPALPPDATPAQIAAKEEADLARAIADSLKDSQTSVSPMATQSVYPTEIGLATSTSPAVAKASPPINKSQAAMKPKRIRALYTFEVQEEGELGLKSGDVALLLDNSHPDWWRAERNGEVGLVPSNYVEVLKDEPMVSPGQSELLQDKDIDPAVIDLLLSKLLTAEETPTDSSFNADIEQLYERVVSEMHPKIQQKVAELTSIEAQLAQLLASYHSTKALYTRLMKDGQLALGGDQVGANQSAYPYPTMQGGYSYQPAMYQSHPQGPPSG
eukprot:Ihof_evm5s196 gene=Ihof_evmTU5s196